MKLGDQPAFPHDVDMDKMDRGLYHPGLTKRELAAFLAMAEMTTMNFKKLTQRDQIPPFVAEAAVDFADALLIELEKHVGEK